MSRTTIRELTKKYRSILLKGALAQALILAVSTPVLADTTSYQPCAQSTCTSQTWDISSNFVNVTGTTTSNPGPGAIDIRGRSIAGQDPLFGTLNVGDNLLFQNNAGFVTGGAITVYHYGILNVGNNVSFIGNTAFAQDRTDPSINIITPLPSNQTGGALSLEGDISDALGNRPVQMTIGDNVLFKNNSATNGGAIYIRQNVTAEIGKNAQFIGNKTQTSFTDATPINAGGAIGVISTAKSGGSYGFATLKIGDNALFDGNGAAYGGAIANRNADSKVTLGDGNTFNGNTATNLLSGSVNRGGGAIFNQGTFTLGSTTFSNNSAQLSGGAIHNDGTGTNPAIMNFNGDTTFVNNTINGGKNDIYNTGTLNFNKGLLTLDGGITGTGIINFAQGSSLKSVLSATTPTTALIQADTLNGTSNFIVENGASDGYVSFDFANGDFKLNNTNALYDVTTSDDKEYQVTKKSTEAQTQSLMAAGASQRAARTISAFSNTVSTNAYANSVLNQITESVQAGDIAGASSTLDAINPTTSPTVQYMAVNGSTLIMNTVSDRMTSENKNKVSSTGRSGGDVFGQVNISPWLSGLYNHNRNTQGNGFKGDIQGFAFGVDSDVTDATTVGLGYARTFGEIKEPNRKTDVYGDNLFAYSQYKPSAWYVNGILNYGWADYKEKTDLTAAKYKVKTYGGQAMTGYIWDIFDNSVGMRYTYVDNGQYNNGVVTGKNKDAQVATAVIGTKISKKLTCRKIILTPEVKLGATYDVYSSHNSNALVNVLGSNTFYQVSGANRLNRFAIETGIGLTAQYNNTELSLSYDGEFRAKNQSNSGMLNLKHNF